MENNRRHLIMASILVVVATPLVYWLLDNVLALPIQATAEAIEIDFLFDMHIWLTAFLFSLVVVMMLYAIVVFRQREGQEDKEGTYFHGNTRLEVIWTVVPLLFVVIYSYWGTTILWDVVADSPDEMEVDVISFQWGWRFEYPEHDIVSQELVLPVDRRVRLELESQDVVHSFYVEEFRVKQDAVPGRTTLLRFTPTVEGEYVVRCAELCGLSHAYMLADVRIVSPEEYGAWVSER